VNVRPPSKRTSNRPAVGRHLKEALLPARNSMTPESESMKRIHGGHAAVALEMGRACTRWPPLVRVVPPAPRPPQIAATGAAAISTRPNKDLATTLPPSDLMPVIRTRYDRPSKVSRPPRRLSLNPAQLVTVLGWPTGTSGGGGWLVGWWHSCNPPGTGPIQRVSRKFHTPTDQSLTTYPQNLP
jgi:hypothetical protein